MTTAPGPGAGAGEGRILAPTLAGALGALGGALRVAAAPRGLEVVVAEPVLWDSWDALPGARGGILLMVGGQPGTAAVRDALTAAAAAGYAAAVVKAHGAGLDAAAAQAEAAGIALLVARDADPWRRVESQLAAAVAGQSGGIDAEVAVGDLFSLANAIASTAGAAVTIEDAEHRVLAYSAIEGQPIDEVRRQSILGRVLPREQRNVHDYAEVAAADAPVRFPSTDDGELPRVAAAVRAGSRVLGSLWAIVPEPARMDEVATVLRDAAPATALHLLRAARSSNLERARRGELLLGLLSGTATRVPPGEWSLLGFAPAVPAAETQSTAADRLGLLQLVAVHCEVRSPASLCADTGGTIFGLVPRAADAASLAWGVVRGARTSLGVELRAAVGEAGPAGDAPRVRREVDLLLRANRTAPGRAGTRPEVLETGSAAQLVVLERLAEAGLGAGALPVVAAIRAHDRAHGTDYERTLLAHLDSFGDTRVAAARLVVHENSQRYRVRRLAELFDLDLDDPELRLVLWLQLRLAAAQAHGPGLAAPWSGD